MWNDTWCGNELGKIYAFFFIIDFLVRLMFEWRLDSEIFAKKYLLIDFDIWVTPPTKNEKYNLKPKT